MTSYLGSLIGDADIVEAEYVIVSKGRDFEAAIDFWADRRKDTTIALRPTIAVAPVISIETLVKPVQKPAPKGTVKPAPKSTAPTASRRARRRNGACVPLSKISN